MANQPDYILFRPDAATTSGTGKTGQTPPDKVYPMSEGLWQQETLDTLKMYGDKGFSPVSPQQGTLFPMDEVATPSPSQLGPVRKADDPGSLIPHWGNFKFFSEDSLRFARKLRDLYLPKPAAEPTPPAEVKPTEKLRTIVTDPAKDIFDPGIHEFKADQFPGRLIYKDGGLYAKGDLKAQENAPNYRQVPGKPIHGVGQPSTKGFHDVLNKLDGKHKPVVWANTRAEAIIYVEGKPYNLRQLAGMENVDLKPGASAAEVEALEEKLKAQLIARGTINVSEEVPTLGADGKPVMEGGRPKMERQTHPVKMTAESCQTTQDVVKGLQAEGYQIDYRRIPLSDEKSPSPAGLDSIRDFMNEMNSKHGKDTQYVFNCHQGKGRTTTAMVTAGITLDGKQPRQLELPFDEAGERAERNIKDNAQLQNLHTTVDEYKKKSSDAGARAETLTQQAASEPDADKKKDLQAQADRATAEQAKYADNAQEFTKRYALLQKYSEYVTEHGSVAKSPSFDEWMKDSTQQSDLQSKWAHLNQLCGLDSPLQMQPQVAYA